LGKAEHTTRLGSAWFLRVADMRRYLFPTGTCELVQRQILETRTALPTLTLFQFCAVLSVSKVIGPAIPQAFFFGWFIAGMILTAVLGLAYYRLVDAEGNFAKAEKSLKLAPLVAAAMGAFWSWVPLVFAHFGDFEVDAILYTMVMMIMIVGLLCVVRLPISAILFSTMIVISMALSASKLFVGFSMVTAVIGTLSATALITMIFTMHVSFVKHCLSEAARRRDTEVIKLLLNEFESGVGDWLWETDVNGRLVYVSPRLSQVLKMPTEALYAESLCKVLRLQADCELGEKLRSSNPILNFGTQTEVDDKTWYWEISANPLVGPEGFLGHRGVGRDITLHKEQTLQIQQAKDDAEKANAAKSQFLAIISHELRTPINAIVGFSEVLSAGQGESLPMAARREYLGTILESAKHLQGLINDVLDATRMERGAIVLDEQFNDASELIEVAVKILRDQAITAKVSLVAHVIDDVQVMSDMTRLKQVILNLITNAIKFSPSGGVVNIDMLRGLNGELIITVRDAGIGISKEDAERVFEPFVQVENGMTRRFGGIGLGLAIARRIARIHGGDLTLDGEMGIGTEARFVLPASRISWPKSKKAVAAQVVAA
jgi:signal transduction histidine kinase